MPTSEQWRNYYRDNAASLLDVPWDLGEELTDAGRRVIADSIAGFQAGESSEGQHLFTYAKRYAKAADDPHYVEAVRLFIAEEQRHARDLARFMALNDIPKVKTTFPDRVFCRLRRFMHGLEISIAVLLTAEFIAMVYYTALREATASRILKRLCDQILRDEVQHIAFQIDYLNRLRAKRGKLGMTLTMGSQRFLYFGTCVVVWVFHRRVLRAGGMSFRKYWRSCWHEFNAGFQGENTDSPAVVTPVTS